MLGVPRTQRSFATFRCSSCDHTFAGDVPAIFVDLPCCPICKGCTQIHRILHEGIDQPPTPPTRRSYARTRRALVSGGLVAVSMLTHPGVRLDWLVARVF